MTLKIKTKKLSYKLASKIVQLVDSTGAKLHLQTTKKVVTKLKNDYRFISFESRVQKLKIIKG
jgi:GTPase